MKEQVELTDHSGRVQCSLCKCMCLSECICDFDCGCMRKSIFYLYFNLLASTPHIGNHS